MDTTTGRGTEGTPEDRTDTRAALAARLGDAVAWRAAAGDGGDPARSLRIADALQELADHVRELPATDARIRTIGTLDLQEGSFPVTSDPVDRLIAAYATNRHMQAHPATFMADLAEIAEQQADETRS